MGKESPEREGEMAACFRLALPLLHSAWKDGGKEQNPRRDWKLGIFWRRRGKEKAGKQLFTSQVKVKEKEKVATALGYAPEGGECSSFKRGKKSGLRAYARRKKGKGEGSIPQSKVEPLY